MLARGRPKSTRSSQPDGHGRRSKSPRQRVLAPSCLPLLAFLTLALPAVAALSPGTVEKLKAAASDVLKVEILRVREVGKSNGVMEVIYESRIREVRRSRSGAVAGRSVEIESYHDTRRIRPPGPKAPPVLSRGWKGTIYLDHKAKDRYRIAVYGHSFDADK
ncbi:MAG: hypothetical protein OER86_01885 [Phycisphaerae bacterium]|nr:hypothetical protein [Phycisphaerae bacterium]